MENVVLPESLLVLPPGLVPDDYAVLKAAYEPPISSALKDISFKIHKGTVGASLDIAVPLPLPLNDLTLPRSRLYSSAHRLVSGLYKLIGVVAAREGINIEDSEGIDVRILLLAAHQAPHLSSQGSSEPGSECLFGPVTDINVLATSARAWQQIYSVDTEEGETLLTQFLRNQDNRLKVTRLRGGQIQEATYKTPPETEASKSDLDLHYSIAVGGTWDHLHIGHKLLLTMVAFLLEPQRPAHPSSRNLIVGVTGDELLRNKQHAELLQSWKDRQSSVCRFLKAIMDFRRPRQAQLEAWETSESGPNGHAVFYALDKSTTLRLVELSDPFGPTITDRNISALVLSAETRSGGKAVNDKRAEHGWPGLVVYEVDVLDASDENHSCSESFDLKLSSTTIRRSLAERGRVRKEA